ncbi:MULTISPECIES: bleomycin resistance protein [Alphaproteobacteria]|uniref:Bleomycin resistance protein n=2 Tax=Alphaproteobacteria TaxID=28211 RepID=A0A512HEL1_9HYPH|nr:MULTISPECIES: VOC family protein [Alphaproteobacteria]GEO83896.1 aldoketomutase [Ciceribacter naphthalenivorans]GLR21226.1 aldoketomutase [Ciceribacter naphthalenivorans]GLT04082.1 aldoketomutase [Sphingomonas psychrolutea]
MTELSRAERNNSAGTGDGPTGGFAALVPELDVTDLAASLAFWCDCLGFRVAYDRPQAKFAYLERQGAQIMLCEINGNWKTGKLERPFGRGVNFQIETDNLESILDALRAASWPLFEDVSENWYRTGATRETGSREFLVQDPDGYLIRFSQSLGGRPTA